MTLWLTEALLFMGMVALIWAMLGILGDGHCVDDDR